MSRSMSERLDGEGLMTQTRLRSDRAATPEPPRIVLLDRFGLQVAGSPVQLPVHARRVLAYLCVGSPNPAVFSRTVLAERLWSKVPPQRSQASLRTALWRIRQADRTIVRTARDTVRLGDSVRVDVFESLDQAARLLSDDPLLRPADSQVTTLLGDLLPGWEEDWLLLERERIRQLQVHAVEALANRLRKDGHFAEAVNAALVAVAAEPLRESAHAALISTYLDEGNVVEAHRQYDCTRHCCGPSCGSPPRRRWRCCSTGPCRPGPHPAGRCAQGSPPNADPVSEKAMTTWPWTDCGPSP